jgi:hypothetical protein
VVATIMSRPDPDRRLSELGWMFAGGAALAAAVAGVALLRGTSPDGLLNGTLLYPLDQRGLFQTPLLLPDSTLIWDAVGLGGALVWTVYRRRATRPLVALEGAVRASAGILIWLILMGNSVLPGLLQAYSPGGRLVLPAALAWIVAAPRGTHDGYEKLDFARAVLPALAILQTLHAYPVAGSQALWAAVAYIPVGAVCIADGLVQLGMTRAGYQLTTALVFLMLAAGWVPTAAIYSQAAYASSVPLSLPGASRIRVAAQQAMVLRQVTQSIRDNCDTFISIPGLDSFYIFAQVQPPSPPPTRWIWLVGDAPAQRAVVDASNRVNRLCVVENDSLIALWSDGRQVPEGPLAAYISSDFVPAYSFDGYSILVRGT